MKLTPRMLGKLSGGLLTLALVIAAALAFNEYRRWTDTPLPVTAPVTVYVAPGTAVQTLAANLAAQGILPNARDLAWQARLRGVANAIQAGEYHLQPGLTAVGLLDKLVRGEVLLHSLTIIEGSTFAELWAQISANPNLQHTLGEQPPADLMAQFGQPDMSPEGWFLPETYSFPRGTRDLDLLRQIYQAMQNYLQQVWPQRAADLPFDTPYEALILASIIEKETAVPAERQQIAGVFVRRLQRGMRLQTDPTVIYGLGKRFDGNLRREDLLRDTPWNTYTRSGLPKTPIALPGKESIYAALHPAAGDALYFVAKGDGSHYFSATLDEHNQAVRRYQLRRGN